MHTNLISNKVVTTINRVLQCPVERLFLLRHSLTKPARPASRASQHMIHSMPANSYRFLYQFAEVWVNLFVILQVGFDAIFLTHDGVVHTPPKIIGTQHNALCFVNTMRGIP